MKLFRNIAFALVSLLLLAGIVVADSYKTKFNPFTGKQDWVNTANFSGSSIIGENLTVNRLQVLNNTNITFGNQNNASIEFDASNQRLRIRVK